MMQKVTMTRVAKWDNIKFLLITLVVVGHFIDMYTKESTSARSLFLFIYLFHMPAFVFLAGLFSKRTVQEKRYDKILGYFVLYLIMKIYFFVVRSLLGHNPTFSILGEGGVPWFIFAIAVFHLITIIVKEYRKEYVLIISVLFACFAGYDKSIGDFLILSRIIVFYPFFYLGYSMQPGMLLKKLEGNKFKIIGCISFLGIAILIVNNIDDLYWLRPLFTGRHPFSKLKEYADYGAILRLSWYAINCCLIMFLIAIVPERRYWFSDLGSRTIQVYALHRPLIYIWQAYNVDFMLQQIWPEHWKLLTIGISILLTFILSSKIFTKPFTWILSPIKR